MDTLEQALHHTTRRLTAVGIDTAALDASLLLEQATGKTRLEMILSPEEALAAEQVEHLEDLTAKRETRQPMAYILGEKEFWGFRFKVRPGVLIPRPDTETLVATVLALLPDRQIAATVVDFGIGSGCILLSLLKVCPRLQGVGVDVSSVALSVAADNAASLDVADRLSLLKGTGLGEAPSDISLIVSNPPYIPTAEIEGLAPDVRDFEPVEALDGGADGLAAYRLLIPGAYEKLHAGGLLVMEIGHDQKTAVTELLDKEQWQNISTYQDLAGRDRVIVAVKASP
jgi:release factor glutamine methyltransferase